MPPVIADAIACLIFAAILLAFLFFLVHYGSRLMAVLAEAGAFFKTHLGANWRTTLTGSGTAIFAGLTGLAALPYEIGPIADIIPPKAKATVVAVAGCATVLLHIMNSMVQKDKSVTGGVTQQDATGKVAAIQVATPLPPAPALPEKV